MGWWYVANFLCCSGVKVADGNTESGVVAVPRRLLGCHDNIARSAWFLPDHSLESEPAQTRVCRGRGRGRDRREMSCSLAVNRGRKYKGGGVRGNHDREGKGT